MKKIIAVLLLAAVMVTGCENSVARNYGGNMTLDLEPGLKLEEITWKDSELWYLTRPMQEGEEPETHTFCQKKNLGVLEGTVTIVEHETEGGN